MSTRSESGLGNGDADRQADLTTEALRDLAETVRAGAELERVREHHAFILGAVKAGGVAVAEIAARIARVLGD
ncbi:hypothetical protein [Kitasatospora sp. NPDC008115]|uniref:hypothetical protein n=1 Tax=Kitasatospora sp. NPDC008115 TaxID=3364022 RepID=UPI0036E3ED1D